MSTDDRIEVLERQLAVALRRQRVLSLVGMAVVGALVATATWPPAVADAPRDAAFGKVTAEAFELVDEHGEVRATMAIDGEDVHWRLLGGQGLVRAELAVTDDGAALVLDDSAGQQRVRLGAFPERHGLMIEGRDGKGAALGLEADRPVLSLHGGEAGGVTAIASDGGPQLRLIDKAGVERLGLAVTEDGPALQLFDEGGTTGVRLRVLPEEYGPALDFLDKEGERLHGLP